MSDIDDCASQEIEASTSSNSERNSEKFSFLGSAFDADKSHNVRKGVRGSVLFKAGATNLLDLDKREFIKNWILAQENTATSPQRSCLPSPVLGTIPNNLAAKHTVDFRITDYQWKRVRRDIDAKENFQVSPNNHLRQTLRPLTTAQTVVIEDEEPEFVVNSSSNDLDKTFMNSPVENGNSTTSTLNASDSSCKFLIARASNKRRTLRKKSSRMPEVLSSSTPVMEIKRADIDCMSASYTRRDVENSAREEASRSFWIAADESPTKLAARRTSKINARSHDDPVLRKKLSTFSPFRDSENTVVVREKKIDKDDRSSVRYSWHAAKNSSTALESGLLSRKNNHQLVIRHSSRLSNAISATSALGECDRIDIESNSTNPAEEEIQIESDSDDTASDFINNIETQSQLAVSASKNICNIEDTSQVSVERRSKRARDLSCDSDETYYSDGDRAARPRFSLPSSSKNSQKISEDKSDTVISQVTSPLEQNCKTSAYVASFNKSKEDNRKKKAKKGSLAAKLQSLVSLQASNLRIWRHQMSQPDFKSSYVQFVTVKIRDRETRWGRHYITATVIADSHCLLRGRFDCRGSSTSQLNASTLERRTITLIINPQITGKIIIRSNSTLNIYPPWDIMDRDGKILNVVYFDVIHNNADVDAGETSEIRTIERLVRKFDCPCIHANAIVDLCPDKFTDQKASVMRALFDS